MLNPLALAESAPERASERLADEVVALLREERSRSIDQAAREPALDAHEHEHDAEAHAVLRDHGRLAPEQELELRRSVFSQVIAPCFRALLAGSVPSGADRMPGAMDQA